MIQIKNISSSTMTIICPDFKFRRKLPVGREIPVAKEIYDELFKYENLSLVNLG